MQDLFPEAKPTIGPAIENGFYYDFQRTEPFTADDLTKLEKRMHEIVKKDYEMTGRRVERSEALERYADNPFKVELARDIPEGEPITLYTIGEFTDLCRGGHAKTTGEIGAVKLMSVAGAYWRGDEHNPMLQRIYGTAFPTQKELDDYLVFLEEAAKRDHRKLGPELDLYSVEEEAGGGLVFWHPKGTLVRGIVEAFIREGLAERGYQPVITPHIVHEKLYETSGHLENFAHGMFGPIEVEGQRFRLKPMNCPGHILIYKSQGHSYRDLPIRYSEFGTVYRFERSGTLHGLTRVRGFTQDDAHLFCTPEQLQGEFEQTLDEALRMMKAFNFDDFEYFLSTREQRGPTDDIAEAAIRNALESHNLPYSIDEGGGAFYGPEARYQPARCDRPQWQLGTVQVDFILPERFELKYRGSDGADHRPVMIHRALAGSMERFFGVLDRALRRQLPGLARAGASGARADHRAPARLRARSRRRNFARPDSAWTSMSPTKSSATRSVIGRRRKFPSSSSSASPKRPTARSTSTNAVPRPSARSRSMRLPPNCARSSTRAVR